MPKNARALTRAAQARAQATGTNYREAREAELAIRKRMTDEGLPYEEAEDALAAEAREAAGLPPLCESCGGPIICPECPGCACYNGRCTGWRHEGSVDFDMDDGGDHFPEDDECDECGGDIRLVGYQAGCICG